MNRFFLTTTLTTAFAGWLMAAGAGRAEELAAASPVAARLAQLEQQTQALRAEVARLEQAATARPAAWTAEGPSAESEEQYELVTVDELLGAMKELAWTKGDYKIVPYGMLWGSASYDTDRTFPGAYTLFVPSSAAEGEDAFQIDTRRTRLGLDITGPRIPLFNCAKSRGKVEIDFHGSFVVENKPGVLLRHAYGEVYNDRFRLLAGQYWDLISPLYPHTVSYSVGWGGGNIGYRRMQVRLERYIPMSDLLQLTAAISVNQNIVSDFAASPHVDPESTDWPILMGRLAATLGRRGPGADPITIGVSGHVGEQGFDFLTVGPPPLSLPPVDDARVKTWSFNVDVRVPITDRLGVQGEFFTGQNLGTFLGGVLQGVDFGSHEGIRTTGGWFEVWLDVTDRLHTHAGFSIDDPLDRDLITATRRYNHFYFANAMFDVTEKLVLGLEVTQWKTLYVGQPEGDAVRFELSGEYGF